MQIPYDEKGEFDCYIETVLTWKQTNEIKNNWQTYTSDISGYKIKVELFTEITDVLQITVFLFAVKQNAVFSSSFAVSLLFGNYANGGFDFGIQGS